MCGCGSGEYKRAEYDGRGIFLCYVCDRCEAEKLSRFRSDIRERYEADEPIEEEG